jgi:hypothetical protein
MGIRKKLEEKKYDIDKITPLHDLSWYIKWISSLIILCGMMSTSIGIHPLNLWFHFIGVCGWFVVGMLWHDRALIVLNIVGACIFAMGLLKYYLGN